MPLSLGVDTGGTFTDFFMVDSESGDVATVKVPSTPSEPAAAFRRGLGELAERGGPERIAVGTTVATNAVIQREGPRVLLVTNEGFTDVPFIGRIDKEHLYDLNWVKPQPLVRRSDCLGVPGRVDHHGQVLEPLEPDALDSLGELVARAAEDGSEDLVVAVCCLFSYLHPGHEDEIAAAVHGAAPDVPVSVSHEVSPMWREYERTSTTIADAFVKPVVDDYVDGVGAAIEEHAGRSRWNMLASNGGQLSAEETRRRPAQLLLSGLAGGVIGGRHYAEAAGHPSAFTLDMGGTSCDIGVVLDGEQRYVQEFDVAWGVPVTIPCVDVKTIGAGGGSIAWLDRGGLLRVGPQSAGAEPGPVAYGQGGSDPTLTDANLVLGRLDPDYFLGGEMPLDGAAARDALASLGRHLSLDAEQAALAVVRIADENMANAIRLVAVERGIDARELALVAFGGAGALHGRAVAARLGIGTVLVPPHPGLCSAFGAAIADARVDRARTIHMRSDAPRLEQLAEAAEQLREDAVDALGRTVDAGGARVEAVAQLRYLGQNYELEVLMPDGSPDAERWDRLLRRFAAEHERQYGFSLTGEVVELTGLRVTASVPQSGSAVPAPATEARAERTRGVAFEGAGQVECQIVRRASLGAGDVLHGPAVVEEPDSTTLVFPGDALRVHESGVLAIELGEPT